MHTVLLPASFDRQPMTQHTRYNQAHHTPRIKERKINWVKVIGVAAPITGALLFTAIYGMVGSMDYNDELIIANAVNEQRRQIVCAAAADSSIQERYGITAEQIKAEDC